MQQKQKIRRGRTINVAAQEAPFSIFQGKVNGRPVLAMIDMGLRDFRNKQHLPFFLSLSTPLNNPTNEGLPTQSDGDNLNTWEDAVEDRLGPAGEFVFVGRVTWDGHRELLYYLTSQQPSMEALKMLSDAHSTRPFALTCDRDEKWEKGGFWLNRK